MRLDWHAQNKAEVGGAPAASSLVHTYDFAVFNHSYLLISFMKLVET